MRVDVYEYIKERLDEDVRTCGRLMRENFDIPSRYKRYERQFKFACLALKEFEALTDELEF